MTEMGFVFTSRCHKPPIACSNWLKPKRHLRHLPTDKESQRTVFYWRGETRRKESRLHLHAVFSSGL